MTVRAEDSSERTIEISRAVERAGNVESRGALEGDVFCRVALEGADLREVRIERGALWKLGQSRAGE